MPSLQASQLPQLIEGDVESLYVVCEPLQPLGADEAGADIDDIGGALVSFAVSLREFCELALAGLEGQHATGGGR